MASDLVHLHAGFESTSSTVPQGSDVAEITSTVLRDWMNLKKRSSMKRNMPPAPMQYMKSPTCIAKKTTKTT